MHLLTISLVVEVVCVVRVAVVGIVDGMHCSYCVLVLEDKIN